MHNYTLSGNEAEFDMGLVAPLADSPLKNRRVAILGSSVFYGAASEGQAIAEYLAARLGCECVKEAVSGTTLCDTGADSYVQRIKRIPATAKIDVFLCQLSTNDASRGLPLGDAGTFNAETITGAMEAIIAYAQKTWRCPVVFVTGSRFESELYARMVARLYELRAIWGIGIVDIYTPEDFNARALPHYMADPIHPTKVGYRDWWRPEIEKQLLAHIAVSDVVLRRCDTSDVGILASLNKVLIDDEMSDNPMSLAQLEERMISFIEGDYRAYFFIKNTDIIGYALLDFSRKPVYLRQFMISREYRRQGAGTSAFNALVGKLCLETLDIEVLPWNEVGKLFWAKCGFRETSICMRREPPHLV